VPVLRFRLSRLERLTGLGREELEEYLFRLKCETEVMEDGETIEVEVNPDRPDMFVGEGVARAVRGLAGLERGWRKPKVVDSGLKLIVESVPQRPFIAAAVVYNVNVDEEFIEELIQFQEKLHETLGRRRVKVAIGFHDLEKMPGREVRYRVAPLDTSFTPLGYPGQMRFTEFLVMDERGEKYGSIALDKEKGSHPFLYAGGEVIAAPPVINADVTRVEPGTKHLFIDVTGTSQRVVAQTLDIIVSNLAERPGAYVGYVAVEGRSPWSRTPLLEERRMTVTVDGVSRWLGVRLSEAEVAEKLEAMRHSAKPLGGGRVEVIVPPYRVDVMREVDLYEDIAIAVGYENILSGWPGKLHGGEILWEHKVARAVRELAVGLGFTEVMQLILTSPEAVEASGFKGVSVEVLNPVQAEYSVLRPSLLVTLLQAAAHNQHKKKPVKIFEVGHVVYLDEGEPRDELRAAFAVLDEEASFENIQAPIYSMLEVLGVEFSVEPASHPMLMEGRAARLTVQGETLGWLGEVKPEVLEAYKIEYPVAAAELSLEVLARWKSRI
jgi:phenylalanyl-tRNA synthetase beta chain